jgi:general secretion pathway protein F
MPLFQYKAVSRSGEVLEGMLDAPNSDGAVLRLQEMGYIPIRAEEASGSRPAATTATVGLGALLTRRNLTQNQIGVVTREIATLLKAGLPLDRTLEILIELAENGRIAEMLTRVRNEVRGGASLSKALDQQKGVFSRFYVNMIRAGEAGGSLPGVLERLADFMERSKALKDSVTSALVYPVILLVVAAFWVLILLIAVVPRFKPIFAQSGKALPFVTQMVIGTGDFLRNWWWLMLLVLAAFVWLVARRLQDPAVRYRWHRTLLGLPLFGDLAAKVEMTRFSRTLATLLANGVTLVGALSIVRDTMGNLYLAEAVGNVSRELKEGRGLGKPMMESGRFPKLATHMIMVGEETGQLDEMLFQVAGVYDREVESAIKRLLALLEPLLILGLGLIIAVVIFSILAAMLTIYDLPM